jgi:hypothetical protein
MVLFSKCALAAQDDGVASNAEEMPLREGDSSGLWKSVSTTKRLPGSRSADY